MKFTGILLCFSVFFFSCSKSVSTYVVEDSNKIFYQTQNVVVQNFVASEPTNGVIQVSFETKFETGIQQIEILSTASLDHFCTIKTFNISENSTNTKQYIYNDVLIKGTTMYYMLRFKDINGNWNYSDYYAINDVQ